MDIFDVTIFDELTPAELNGVEGGSAIITVIGVVSGCVTIVSAAYDFFKGLVERKLIPGVVDKIGLQKNALLMA